MVDKSWCDYFKKEPDLVFKNTFAWIVEDNISMVYARYRHAKYYNNKLNLYNHINVNHYDGLVYMTVSTIQEDFLCAKLNEIDTPYTVYYTNIYDNIEGGKYSIHNDSLTISDLTVEQLEDVYIKLTSVYFDSI